MSNCVTDAACYFAEGLALNGIIVNTQKQELMTVAVLCISRQLLFDFRSFVCSPHSTKIIAVVCRILLTRLALEHHLCSHGDSSAHTHHTFSPNMNSDADRTREAPKKQPTGNEDLFSLGAPIFITAATVD